MNRYRASGQGRDRLAPLAELARTAATPREVGEASDAAWLALCAGLDGRARRRRRRWGMFGASFAVVAVLSGLSLWKAQRGERLTYLVEGVTPGLDGYLPRVEGQNARVRFSDGTEVALDHASRVRVISTSVDGAQLRLDEGRAHFSVVHRRNAHWSVEAGPFVVMVTGTTFDVRWSGSDGVLQVHLLAGVVTVRGPLTRGGVTLLPGQALEARPDDGTLRIDPTPAHEEHAAPVIAVPPPDAAVARAGAPAGERPALPRTSPTSVLALDRQRGDELGATAEMGEAQAGEAQAGEAPAGEVPTHEPEPAEVPSREAAIRPAWRRPELGADWNERLAKRDFGTILQEVKERGAYNCLRSLPSDRLAALGEAARQAGLTELGRRVLVAQRTRFPGSAAAQEAAFLLGRLAEDAGEPRATALRWYERYLDEAPSGAFAEEALGRKLVLGDGLIRRETTRAVAHEIVERYPTGTYAALARRILERLR